MTDQTPDGGGPSLSFEKVPGPARPERAPARDGAGAEHPGATLAFETAPRRPAAAPPTAAATRALIASALAEAADAPPRATAFEAVPASVGIVQRRMSTAGVAHRPAVADVPGISIPGGKGWNIRGREETSTVAAHAEPVAPAWSTRTTPAMTADRSAWDVPAAPRRRHLTARAAVGIVLTVILVAILGFAGFEWLTGRNHSTATTIATPANVGTLSAISTAATATVTGEMKKVMLADGATRVVSGVYGIGGHPTLIVLLAQGPDTGTTSSQFFDDFTGGLESDGLTVNRSRTIVATSDGSDFICSPGTRPAPLTAVSLCGWDDGAIIGLVMDVSGQPINTTLSEAEAARTTGEH
jgi:hypothetical protein